MHSTLDWTSLPRVEESIRGVQQTAGDSGSSGHSILTCCPGPARHWHFLQPLPQGGSACAPVANWVISQGGKPGLLGTAGSLSAISRQWKCAAGITSNRKQKHRKLGSRRATGAARPPGAKLMDPLKLSQPAQGITTDMAMLTTGKLHEN